MEPLIGFQSAGGLRRCQVRVDLSSPSASSGNQTIGVIASTWQRVPKLREHVMRVKGWNNGRMVISGAGYGLRISPSDRDRFFDRS